MACLRIAAMVRYNIESSVLPIGEELYLVIVTATPDRTPPRGIITKSFECRSAGEADDFRTILTEQIRRVVEAIGGEVCKS
jgi:hypothetical protein